MRVRSPRHEQTKAFLPGCARMYGPAVRRKMMFGRLTNVRAASMYSASVWSFSSGPSWVSARIQDSLAARPLWAIMAPSLVVAPGRLFVHLLHPLADLGGKLPVIG